MQGYDVILLDLDPDKNLRKLFLEDQESDDDASLYVPSHKKGELGATITVLNSDEWDERSYPDVKIVICDCSPVLAENLPNLVARFDYCVIPTTLNPLGVAKNGDVSCRVERIANETARDAPRRRSVVEDEFVTVEQRPPQILQSLFVVARVCRQQLLCHPHF